MKSFTSIVITASMLGSLNCLADIAIIAHKDTNVNLNTAKEIRNVYLGKRTNLSNGETAVPLDQANGSEIQAKFSKIILRKSLSSLNSYWSRQMFSGKGKPPKQITGGDKALISAVTQDKNAIAYIDASNTTGSVKVLLTVQQ